MGKRRRARELALQFLFQIDMNPPVKGGSFRKGSEVDGVKDSEDEKIPVKDSYKSSIKDASTRDASIKKTAAKDDSPKEDEIGGSLHENIDTLEKAGAEDTDVIGDGLESDDLLNPEMERAIDIFKENFKTDETAIPFFLFLVRGVCRHRERIDRIINDTSENWKLDRMGVVDRNILRFAIFELMFADDIPSSVSMNEAIEIAKRYGTADSPSFINGILDKIASVEKKSERTGSRK